METIKQYKALLGDEFAHDEAQLDLLLDSCRMHVFYVVVGDSRILSRLLYQ
jgi:hypothetical protein